MHDPMTVAHEIKRPWRDKPTQFWPKGYRPTIVTIWHVDPELSGSDDSCGFTIPHLSERQRERLKNFAWSEGRNPYFMRCRGEEWTGSRSEAEAIYRALLLHVADCIGVPLTFWDASRQAATFIHAPDCTDRAGALCFLPGYHSNFNEDRADQRERRFMEVTSGIARWLLRDRRPWYRHPRWHIHHWKIQIHAINDFKRWAFSRCATCGRGFGMGASVITNTWDSDGPRWFRGERDVHHMDCHAKGNANAPELEQDDRPEGIISPLHPT